MNRVSDKVAFGHLNLSVQVEVSRVAVATALEQHDIFLLDHSYDVIIALKPLFP
jgi:hypothetical protein